MQTHSPYSWQSMNSTGMNLLQAVAEFVSGETQLAVPLGIAQSSVGKFTADLHHAPDPVLLWTVDIVLAHRQSPIPLVAIRTSDLGRNPAIRQ